MTTAIHGTYAGAQKHRKDGERPCPDCHAGQADYIQAWRIRTGRIDRIIVTVNMLRALNITDHIDLLAKEVGPQTTKELLKGLM